MALFRARYFRGQFELSCLAASEGGQSHGDHLNRQDLENGTDPRALVWQPKTFDGCSSSNEFSPASSLLNVTEQSLIQSAGLLVSRKNDNQRLITQHLDRPMPESRAAHPFRMKVSGFLHDERPGFDRSQGASPAREKQVANPSQFFRKAAHVLLPMSEVCGNCRWRASKFAAALARIALA